MNTILREDKMMHLVRAIDEQEAREAALKRTGPGDSQSNPSNSSTSPKSDDAQRLVDCRKDKSEKERNRRSHLKELYDELGALLGVTGRNKAQVLEDARNFLMQKNNSSKNKT